MQDYHRSNIFNLVMTTDQLYSKKKEGTSPETTFRQTIGRDSSQKNGNEIQKCLLCYSWRRKSSNVDGWRRMTTDDEKRLSKESEQNNEDSEKE